MTSLRAVLEDKVGDSRQRRVAAEYLARSNYTITNGCFEINLLDGELLYFSALPLEDMSLADSNDLLPSW